MAEYKAPTGKQHPMYKHGGSTNKYTNRVNEYDIWCNMKYRCYNQNCPQYKDWGGRGIKVCDRWLNSFENFISEMGYRPTKKHSIERLDNNGDYEPSNCRWATRLEQARNMSRNKLIEHNGEKMVQKDWAKRLGTDDSNIVRLFRLGKTFEEIYNHYSNPNYKKFSKI